MRVNLFCLLSFFMLLFQPFTQLHAKPIPPKYKSSFEFHKKKMKETNLSFELNLSHGDSAIKLARKFKDKFSEADALYAKGCVYSSHGSFAASAKITKQALDILNRMSDTASSHFFNELYAKSLNNIGYSQAYCSNFTEALNCFRKMIVRFETDSTLPYAAWAYNGFAYIYTTQKKYKEAELYAHKALAASQKLNDTKLLYGSYANLGDIYFQQNLYDQALSFFLEQQKIASTNPFEGEAAIHTMWSMAEIYHKKEKETIAEQYYLSAIKTAEIQNPPLCMLIKSNYGSFLIDVGRTNDALTILQPLLKQEQINDYIEYKINVLKSLTRIYEQKGDYKKAMIYLRNCYDLRDSAYIMETSEKLDLLQKDFEGYKILTERKLNEQNLGLEHSNSQKKNLWIAFLSLLCAVTLSIMGYVINRILKQRKLNGALNEKLDLINLTEAQRIESKKQQLLEDINEKYKKILPDSLLAAQFAGEINSLKQKVSVLKYKIPQKEDTAELIKGIETILKSFSSEKQWAEFKLLFEHLGENFYESLQKQYPDLNSLDMRLCALISMNLSTKEIASLTNKSVRGIESAKFRLRKKMKLEPEADLFEVIIAHRSE